MVSIMEQNKYQQESVLTEKTWTKEMEIERAKKIFSKERTKFNPKTKKKIYSIDTPPPFINAPIHIGHATTYVLMDMFARYKKQKGFEVIFPLGLDRNGLPIEVAAEKKFNVKLTTLSREKALEYCEKVLAETSLASTNAFKGLAIEFNSYQLGPNVGDAYYTDMEDYRILTQATFIELWNKGLIYEDERINNWDPALQTTIADSEIDYKDIETLFNDIKFKCKETGEDLIIGTTRPELISSCGMVIFNPEDKRYKQLNGKTAITPIYNREVKIKADPSAKIDKGTGLAMMCSAGDLSDIRFFRDNNIKPIISINKDGTMNKNAGFLEGLKVKEARQKMIEELEAKDLLVSKRKVMHTIPISERSKAEIEFISMKEYYMKQMQVKDKIMEIAKETKIYSENSRQLLIDWINSVNMDWPISRRRYYGTEIPLWFCEKCGYVYLPKPGKYYRPWKESPDIKECPECKHKKFIGETRIFDTWFDSSSSPQFILGYYKDRKFYDKNTPCSLRPQGKEIIRTWLYYTLLKSYLLNGKNIFDAIWINHHILDGKGIKMSKSLGNTIDPQEVIAKYGCEPFRLWACLEGNITNSDMMCSYDRISGATKTIIKLWNVAKFISSFKRTDKATLTEVDKSILTDLDSLIKESEKSFEEYDFHNPSKAIKHFIWEDLASHYLEIAKKRIYSLDMEDKSKEAAIYTLYTVLEKLLVLLHPINPLITEEIYSNLYKKEICLESFPELENIKSKVEFSDIIKINTEIWKYKQENTIKNIETLESYKIPKELEAVKEDIALLHNIKTVK